MADHGANSLSFCRGYVLYVSQLVGVGLCSVVAAMEAAESVER